MTDVRPGHLSPSRAIDFMQCPQKYKYRVIDKLPEPPSTAAVRGTLVHAVLETLFTYPADQRTPDTAKSHLPGAWEAIRTKEPDIVDVMVEEGLTDQMMLEQASTLVDAYFRLENPAWLEPHATETRIEHHITDDLRILGIMDRLDIAPAGQVRIVDYKTGKAPKPQYQDKIRFQMLFYAAMYWRVHGVIPMRLTLHFLGSADTISHDPNEGELLATERKILALWGEISEAKRTGEWRTKRSKLCDWCYHQKICPAFAGTQ